MTTDPAFPLNRLILFFAAVLSFRAFPLQATAPPQAGSPTKVNLQVIVVDSEAKAQQVEQRLLKGDDFATIARETSISPSASSGGVLGEVDPSTLRPELRQALAGMKVGDISGVVKVATGLVIIKLLPPSQAPAGPGMSPAQGVAGPGMASNHDLNISGKGAVQYPADVAGQVLADMLFQNFPKPAHWEQDLQEVCTIRKDSLAGGIDGLKKLTSDATRLAAIKPYDRIQTHYALAQLEAYRGNMSEAVEQWESAYQLAASDVPAGIPQLTEVLGVAYLHKSEMENDAYRKPGERCIFPPASPSCYAITADSEKAVEYFTKYLELKPERPDVVQVKWLLNLAYLTLGKYPGGVPQRYLVPQSVFASQEDIGRFVDVATATGLNLVSMADGVIVDDFENDGLLDVVISSYDYCGPLHFFHNNGDGTFTDRTAQAGLSDQLGGLNAIQADYNNDGCMDILILRGAWEFPVRKSLLRNNCDGTFTDVTKEAGLAEPATRTQTAVWADIDNDGYLDFYVSNLYGGNFLYHNNHDRTFTEVSEKAGVHQPQSQSFATWFFDYDNDGWPDIFVTSYFFSVDEALRSYLGLAHNAETFKLYKNMKNGTFKDVTAEVGLDKINVPMGANFGDVDNDGFLDIFLATGGPEYGALIPKMLLRNDDGKSFVDITASSGTGELHKGHGVAFADLGNNGLEDILASIGGATPGDAHAFRVFQTPGNGNDWVTVKLVGEKTNRSAIGARIHVTVENEGKSLRSIYRTVGSGGSFGASPLQQHIGLGKSAKIASLEIWWPESGTKQTFSNIGTNQFIEIQEFAKDYTKLRRKSFRLGATPDVTKLPNPAAQNKGATK